MTRPNATAFVPATHRPRILTRIITSIMAFLGLLGRRASRQVLPLIGAAVAMLGEAMVARSNDTPSGSGQSEVAQARTQGCARIGWARGEATIAASVAGHASTGASASAFEDSPPRQCSIGDRSTGDCTAGACATGAGGARAIRQRPHKAATAAMGRTVTTLRWQHSGGRTAAHRGARAVQRRQRGRTLGLRFETADPVLTHAM